MELLQDAILKYILEHDIAHPGDIKDKFSEQYGVDFVQKSLSRLESYELVQKAPHKMVSVILTQEGIKAAKMGFNNYMALLEKKKKQEHRLTTTSLISNYITIGNAIFTGLGFILGVCLKEQLLYLWKQIISFLK